MTSASPARRPRPLWPPLTTSVKRANLPGRLLNNRFPNVNDLVATYRVQSAEQLVPRGQADPRLLGPAFDIWVQLQPAARPALGAATAGARRCGPAVLNAWHELLDRLGPQPSAAAQDWEGPSSRWDRTGLAQLSWAAAMLVVPYRLGGIPPGSPLTRLPADVSGQDLLDLAPTAAVQELLQLAALADERLIPTLRQLIERGPAHPGVQPAGYLWMPADIDLICGRMLLEVKVLTSPYTRSSIADTLRQLSRRTSCMSPASPQRSRRPPAAPRVTPSSALGRPASPCRWT